MKTHLCVLFNELYTYKYYQQILRKGYLALIRGQGCHWEFKPPPDYKTMTICIQSISPRPRISLKNSVKNYPQCIPPCPPGLRLRVIHGAYFISLHDENSTPPHKDFPHQIISDDIRLYERSLTNALSTHALAKSV